MTTPTETRADAAARERIEHALDETLFVEAGAGTGKTTALVRRIINLVLRGTPIERVAAITFTEAAAGELKDRVRSELEKKRLEAAVTSPETQSCTAALDHLDEAAIQTLHAFAQRILALYPLEAGLPPAIEIADEIRSGIAFDEDWQRFMDELLHQADQSLGRGFLLGLQVKHLRDIALDFNRNLDRLRDATFPDAPFTLDRNAVVLPLRAAIVTAQPVIRSGKTDSLIEHLETLPPVLQRIEQTASDEDYLLALTTIETLAAKNNAGQAPNWGGPGPKKAVHDLLREAEDARASTIDAARAECLMPVLRTLREFTLARAAERRRQGILQFDDLLVLARDLLRNNEAVRLQVSGRYDNILIDEFQDTDPIQIEIAALLASKSIPGARSWYELDAEPGRLFFVGDPKQSIYRFRRADIALYHKARGVFGATENLTNNFRSRPPIREFVNTLFSELMVANPNSGGQPEYVPLTGGRKSGPDGQAVHLVGRPHPDTLVAKVRAAEAEDLVSLITTMRGHWQVTGKDEQLRAAKLGDIAILLPSRPTFSALERELESAQIPFRLESKSLLYGTQEVVDLTNLLGAIDDPADDVSVVAALRSPAFACSDIELWEHRNSGGYWDYDRPHAATVSPEHAVALAMAELKRYHEGRWWVSVSELVELLIRERRLLEIACANRRPRETWHRLHFVLDQARAFDQAGGATLRQFVAWLRTQAEEGSRVSESVVPEADDDAIRVLTVHAAKGLEFPIVILAGLNREPMDFRGTAIWSTGTDSPAVRVGRAGSYFKTPGFDAYQQDETAMGKLEDVRLYYVAATRARDHLIVSLHHPAKKDPSMSHARETYDAVMRKGIPIDPVPPRRSLEPPPPVAPPPGDPLVARQAWLDARERVIRQQTSARAIAATAIAKQLGESTEEEKPEQTDTDQPWRKGRAGTSIGRAVHAVLQTIDLATGAGLESAAAAQATAEGIPGREREVEDLVRRALQSASVRTAVASGRFWREVYVAAEIEGTLVEGFIDLLYESPAGLVIVDYKTDALTVASLDAAMERYAPQGAAYALALQTALPKMTVAACRFLFVRANEEHAVANLPAQIARVRDLIAGAET